MSNWSIKTPPTYFPTAVATASGWSDPVTGEVLVAMSGLVAKKADALVLPTFTLAVPANGTYNANGVLTFTITASEPVLVAGAPTLGVTIGSTLRSAAYDPVTSTSTALVFKYTIQTGEVDANGIAVNNVLTLGMTGKGKSKIVDVVADSTGAAVPDASVTFTVPSTVGIIVA